MIAQYEHIMYQTLARLEEVINKNPSKPLADISLQSNIQSDQQRLMSAGDKPKIVIYWAGDEMQSSSKLADTMNLSDTAQIIRHTIQVSICSSLFMARDHADSRVSTLALIQMVRMAMQGMKYYPMDGGVVVKATPDGEDNAATLPMVYLDQTTERVHQDTIICNLRFQCREYLPADELLSVEKIWGVFKQITVEEYQTTEGEQVNINNIADEIIQVN
jgi:hypothetical protein